MAKIDIAKFAGPMERRYGLPRPDWPALIERLEGVKPDEQAEVWSEFERYWQQTLVEAWGKGFRVVERHRILLTTDLPDRETRKVLKFIAKAGRTIDRLLAAIGLDAALEAEGLDVVIVCRSTEDYVDYVCDFDEETYEGGVSAGVCIRAGSVHVVAQGQTLGGLGETLAHELGHSRLAEWPLPGWLDEGIVMLLESAVLGGSGYDFYPDQIQLHQQFWDAHRLDRFFRGYGFNSVEDGHGLHYVLAKWIVKTLMERDREAFGRFVTIADAVDGGAAAYTEVYGGELIDLVPSFIRDAAEENSAEARRDREA